MIFLKNIMNIKKIVIDILYKCIKIFTNNIGIIYVKLQNYQLQ